MAQVFGTGRYSETPIRTNGDCSGSSPHPAQKILAGVFHCNIRSVLYLPVFTLKKYSVLSLFHCIIVVYQPFSLSRNASNSGMVMSTCLARVLLSSLTTPASAS